VVAIGILGKPNKPEYRLPATLKDRCLFDVTSVAIRDSRVLIVGGGDSASEYCQYLAELGNRVTLSYRRTAFTRMNRINKQSLEALVERKAIEFLGGSNIARLAAVRMLSLENRSTESGSMTTLCTHSAARRRKTFSRPSVSSFSGRSRYYWTDMRRMCRGCFSSAI
jgi:thioredoxin reductase